MLRAGFTIQPRRGRKRLEALDAEEIEEGLDHGDDLENYVENHFNVGCHLGDHADFSLRLLDVAGSFVAVWRGARPDSGGAAAPIALRQPACVLVATVYQASSTITP